MATIENLSPPASSVAPSDSASNPVKQKKTVRAGKNTRMRLRSGPSSNASAPSGDSTKVNTFVSRSRSAPAPAPGKYPVVFSTGPGEPTSDRFMSIDEKPINDLTGSLSDLYLNHPMYAQFASFAGYSEGMFEHELSRSFLLAIAQQVVHAHVNMGLPLGDFSSVSSTDVYLPAALRAVVQQVGEFSVPALGVRYLYKDYATTVSSLVHAASLLKHTKTHIDDSPIKRLWLPMNASDQRTRHILANRLALYMSTHGLKLDVEALASHITVDPSPAFDAVKTLLPEDQQNRFDFLFNPLPDVASWVSAFNNPNGKEALSDLGLFWDKPHPNHLDFNFQTKVQFPSLVESWSRKRATIEKFFSCGSGLANKTSALGSASQLSRVSTDKGITRVEMLVGVQAPDISLLACFPLSVRFDADYAVTVVTVIPVAIRAIEFAQQDWKD